MLTIGSQKYFQVRRIVMLAQQRMVNPTAKKGGIGLFYGPLSSLVATILLSGCSNSTLIKSQDLSASSIKYTKTVNELLDKTIDHVIDVDSKELLRVREVSSNPKKMLKEKNTTIKSMIRRINDFRHQTSLTNNYFVNLQALADSTVKNDVGVNVGRLSSRIHFMNNRPRSAEDSERIDKLLSQEEESYIGKLSSMIVGSFYAARIETALRRDAPIIGKQMLLQEKQLNNILAIFQDRLDADSRMHLTDEVIAPFVDIEGGSFEKLAWFESRKRWFQLRQAAPIFADVKEAHKALRLAWEDILRGKKDIGAVDIMLTDVNDFLGTLHALDESRSDGKRFKTHPTGE